MNVSAAVVQKVLKGRWEHWRWGVQWLAIRSWQQPIQNSFEADSYKLHEKLLNNSMLTILQSSTLEANWKGENLDKGVPHVMSRPHQKKKNCHFEVLSSLILHSNNKPFLEQIVTWNEKWIVYSNQQWPTQWMDWEMASKPNLHPKKRSWSLFGGLLLVWSTIALVKPLHLRSMLNKLMRCTKNCNTFSQHCPAKGSSSPPWLLPTACHTTNIQQLSKLG